jgi:hypothetical protein
VRLPCCRYNARTMALTAEWLQEIVAGRDAGENEVRQPAGRR